MSRFFPFGVNILICLCAFFWAFSLRKWEKPEGVIAHDVHNYYGYLPAWLIYDDIKLVDPEKYRYGDNLYHIWWVGLPDGKHVFKYTSGLALLYLPFFAAAHFVALSANFTPDGFSEPYQFLLLLSSIFYLFIGLDFCRRILDRLDFSPLVAGLVICTLGLGTNLFAYASSLAAMPHVYNFALIAVFVFLVIRWYESGHGKHLILLGPLFGLITLVRPSNALIILIPLLYNFPGWISKIFNKRHLYQLLTALVLAIVIWLPQLFYWKTVTGNFWFYSYVDEHFYWLNSHVIDGLFSFRKGWFVYTPLMLVACIGIFIPRQNTRAFRWAIPVFLIVNIYVIFSWWCWWYGGSFGQRSMIDAYAVLAIPLAVVVERIARLHRITRVAALVIAGFLVWLNLFQTVQFEKGSLHYDGMSKELYVRQFGKIEKISGYEQYIDWIDYEKAKHPEH